MRSSGVGRARGRMGVVGVVGRERERECVRWVVEWGREDGA